MLFTSSYKTTIKHTWVKKQMWQQKKKKRKAHTTWTLSCGYASKWLRYTSFLADAPVALDCKLRPLYGPSNKIDSHFKCDRLSRFVPSSWHTGTAATTATSQGKNTHNILWHTGLTRGSRASTQQLNASWSLTWPLLKPFKTNQTNCDLQRDRVRALKASKTNWCEKNTQNSN